MVNKVEVNKPIVEALKKDPKCLKGLEEVITTKSKMEKLKFSTLSISTTSTILEGLPRKREDPRSFYIPLSIYTIENVNAFADLGASINVMLLLIFKRLGLDDTKEIKINVEVAKRCLMKPLGIAENILVEEYRTKRNVCMMRAKIMEEKDDSEDFPSTNVVKIIVNMDRFIKDKVKHYASVYILEIVDAQGCDSVQDEQEIGNDIFKIGNDVFSYEATICIEYTKFNYLFRIEEDVFTCEIKAAMSYEEAIYRCLLIPDEEVPWSNQANEMQDVPVSFHHNRTVWAMNRNVYKMLDLDKYSLESMEDFVDLNPIDGFLDEEEEEFQKKRVSLNERYTSAELLENMHWDRTKENVCKMRAKIMEEIDESGLVQVAMYLIMSRT
ncbi:hypothetical protein Tco_1061041 [Tanacetum coccineum]